MKNEEHIKKWLDGSLTDEEKAYFQQTEEYKKLQKLDNSLKAFKAPEYNTEAGLKRLLRKKSSPKGKVTRTSFLNPFLKVAAALIIMIGIYYYFYSEDVTTVRTSIAEKTEILLPDSSSVLLSSLSTLTYNEDTWERDREVKLTGEAFFKVKKGSTFDVNTEKGMVSVVGTEFNVKVRNEYFEVICYDGLVQVAAINEKISITANHIFKLENGVISTEIKEVTPHLVTEESAFYSVPFGEVIREMERQYQIQIEATGIDLSKRFSGRFVHSDLEMALRSVMIPMDLTFKINEDQKKVVLYSEAE